MSILIGEQLFLFLMGTEPLRMKRVMKKLRERKTKVSERERVAFRDYEERLDERLSFSCFIEKEKPLFDNDEDL